MHRDIEIVTVDSMQVYRAMDIGTAKPTPAERAAVPHHLVDIADPAEEFTVASFKSAATDALRAIEKRGHRALLVGGTGLYLRAVIDDLDLPGQYPSVKAEVEYDGDTAQLHHRLTTLDPVAASRMEPTNRRRVVRALEVTIGSGRPFSSFGPGLGSYPPTPFRLFGLRVERDQLDDRITSRFGAQMAGGFLAEVETLHHRPDGLSRTARQALGYKELLAHLDGETSLEEAVELAITRTKQFARRQDRWFRRDPRIGWIDSGRGHNHLDHDDSEQNVLARLDELLGD
jgi:tRNA dimethylallyltransferase